MALGKRKFLWCERCSKETWATLVVGYHFSCNECQSDIDLRAAKRKVSRDRKASRTHKAKQSGTYKSDAKRKHERRVKRRGEPDLDYMLWIKLQPCLVPGCRNKDIDAHHSVPKSQGGADRTCIPLCHYHHIGVYHGRLGSPERAKDEWGIVFEDEVVRLNELYKKRFPQPS